jgi:hypothetical protein
MNVIEMWLPIMSAAVEWNDKIFAIMTSINQEWLDFVGRELAAGTVLPKHLAACISLQDACNGYADFIQKAVSQHHAEVVALSGTPPRP